MHNNLKFACLALACLAVADITEETDTSLEGYEHHLVARAAVEEDATAIKAQYGDDIDVGLEGYDHLLVARDETAADIKAEFGSNVDVSLDGYDDATLRARGVEDHVLAARYAKALADSDEEYDHVEDEGDEVLAKRHAQALADSDEEYDHVPDEGDDDIVRREAEPVVSPSVAEKKRLGRMRPHYVKHEERMAEDLKQFMKRYADEEGEHAEEEEVDVSLDGYDHELVRRADDEDSAVGEGDQWEEPEEELKGYDHSKLLARSEELTPEEHSKYLKEWNSIVARDFKELEDDDEDNNDRYVDPEDTEVGTTEKRGLPSLKNLRKGVKVMEEKRSLPVLTKLRKGVKVMLGYGQ